MAWPGEDASLLDALRRGDAESWRRFVIRWLPLISSAARRTLERTGRRGSASEVEDATQEVFLKLVKDDFRALRQYDSRRATLSTWLTVVARSVTIDLIRRSPPVAGNDGAGRPGLEPQVSPVEPGGSTVALCVDLTPRQRLVLHLLFDRDLDVAEVARALGVEEQTVRSTKHKAVSKLRTAMTTDAGAEGWPLTGARTTRGDA